MICRWAHWRNGNEGREPIAAVGETPSIAKTFTPSQQYWGKITSKRKPRYTREELESIAYSVGCSVDSLKRAIDQGLFDG